MRYKTKLFVAAIATSAISSILALSIVEYLTRRYLFSFLQHNVSSIAGTSAAMIDGDLVQKVKTLPDENSPDFMTLVQHLRRARDANRRQDTYVRYLYITYPDPNDPHKFIFAADGEEDLKNYSPPGSSDPGSSTSQVYNHLDETFTIDKPTTDPWGTWFTGYAPIYDSQGKYAGTIGADISAQFIQKKLNYLLLFALIAFILSMIESIIIMIFHANKVTRALGLLEQATKEVKRGNFKFRLNLNSNDEFEDLGNMMNTMNEWLEQNEKVKKGFTHYISQNVLEKLTHAQKEISLEGQKRKLTVLYCHIHDFSKLIQNLSPIETLSFLNQYFKTMLEILFKHNGMLDKLLGDGIIAEFGIPIEDPEQESHAVAAAIEMQEAMKSLDAKWYPKILSHVYVQMGIHTGETIVGTIDSEDKFQYTSIGDTVEIASQIGTQMKEDNQQIIITESTKKSLSAHYLFEEKGVLPLKEAKEQIRLYKILL